MEKQPNLIKSAYQIRLRPYLHSAVPFLLSVALIHLRLITVATAASSCRTDCGLGLQIRYPLAVDDGCGNPNFQGLLACSTDGNLNLSTPSGPYQIQGIDYNTRTLVLSIKSSSAGLGPCYRFLSERNFSLPAGGLFSVFQTTFLLMNCPKNSTLLSSPQHFCNFTNNLCEDWRSCPGYTGPVIGFDSCCVHQSTPSEHIDPAYLKCPSLFFTSMWNLRPSDNDSMQWNYGIQLQWQEPLESTVCKDCQASNGTCGYSSINSFHCICEHGNTTSSCNSFAPTSTTSSVKPSPGDKSQTSTALILGISLPAASGCVFSLLMLWWYRRSRSDASDDKNDEGSAVLPLAEGIARRFSYQELVTATSNFKVELGRGGYGIVYKGILGNGDEIAVKVLEGSQQIEQTFQSEVATLGSINHLNLVKLYGYCLEGTKRLLVYEYMYNGSLNKYIFRGRTKRGVILDWEKRYAIALGAARGIEYLHEGCRRHIVHCDIKPENILLDRDFGAKVADFGLAKLMDRQESHFGNSRVRGTCGYIAPEWLQGPGAITMKSDVYSFGMMLLEIVSGRRNVDPKFSTERLYFPDWAQQKVHQVRLSELIDERLGNNVDNEQVRLVIQVALWCIQEQPYARPAMSHVVQMMEGTMQVPQLPAERLSGT